MRYARCPSLRAPLASFLLLALAACGGGSGGGGGGGGGPNTPPTASVLAPTLGVAGLFGDRFVFSFVANDDDDAVVRIVADADRMLATQGDQVVLFEGLDGDGAQQDVPIAIDPPLALGDYTLFLDVDDGVNPVLVIELPRPLIVYPALAGVGPPRSNRYGVVDRTVVFSRGEAEDGNVPLNGDLLPDDGVLVVYDAATQTLTQPVPGISMDVTGVAGGRVRPVLGDNATLAWLTLEADEGANLNAANGQNPVPPIGGPDVDAVDVMVSYVRPGIGPAPTTNTYAGVTAILGVESGLVLTKLAEAAEGAGGTILNGDLDVFDAFFGYVDTTFAVAPFEWNQHVLFTIPPGPGAGFNFRNAGTALAGWFYTEAGAVPGADFNGDLDAGDTLLALGNLMLPGGTGVPGVFTGNAGFSVMPPALATPVDATGGFDVTADGYAGYYADELSDNTFPGLAAGNDRNGDGVIGFAAAFYDTATATETIPPGTAGPMNSAPGSPLVYDTPRMFFTAVEAPRVDPMPGTNGDGDGGADLQLVYWTDHSVMAPMATPLAVNFGGGLTLTGLSLDAGGTMTRLAPGWIALVVNELANGGQDINGSGAVDFAYLLVDTQAGPNPAVHNPGIVPSTAGTFPLAGLWGQDTTTLAQGVVVRLTEQANGDLDGDMDGTDTFFAFLDFSAPTAPILLDAGGDHCAVADGRIAITTDEALTGADYNGNFTTNDVLFRVFDFTGAVLEAGLPCSRLSVPVTENGALFAYLRDEATEARLLNADMDMTDLVLGLWIP